MGAVIGTLCVVGVVLAIGLVITWLVVIARNASRKDIAEERD